MFCCTNVGLSCQFGFSPLGWPFQLSLFAKVQFQTENSRTDRHTWEEVTSSNFTSSKSIDHFVESLSMKWSNLTPWVISLRRKSIFSLFKVVTSRKDFWQSDKNGLSAFCHSTLRPPLTHLSNISILLFIWSVLHRGCKAWKLYTLYLIRYLIKRQGEYCKRKSLNYFLQLLFIHCTIQTAAHYCFNLIDGFRDRRHVKHIF
jgi:hypothetical protein